MNTVVALEAVCDVTLPDVPNYSKELFGQKYDLNLVESNKVSLIRHDQIKS